MMKLGFPTAVIGMKESSRYRLGMNQGDLGAIEMGCAHQGFLVDEPVEGCDSTRSCAVKYPRRFTHLCANVTELNEPGVDRLVG